MQKIKQVFRKYPLHPLFAGLFPVIALSAANIDNTPLSYVVTPVLVSLVGAMLLWSVLYIVTRRYYAAALSTSWFTLLFFSYGHVFELTNQALRHRYLLAAWGILLLGGVVISYHISKKSERKILYIANIITATLFILPLGQIVVYESQTFIRQEPRADHLTAIDYGKVTPPAILPDIYYIIVDGHASEWAYRDFFKTDISEFTSFLKEHNFYTVPKSTTNYPRTIYSLPSSFNMDYLDTLAGSSSQEAINAATLELVENNRLISFMNDQGYRTIFVGSAANLTVNNRYADENINYLPFGSEFGEMLFQTTVLKPISEKIDFFDVRKAQWKRINYEMDELGNIASRPEPTFTLAHLATPHYPHVFDIDGTYVPLQLETERGLSDSYVRQTKYLHVQLENLIGTILKESTVPPIIVIHSDHGSGMTGDTRIFDSYRKERQNYYITERMRNFMTLYLPGVPDSRIPKDLSSVNIFRIVLNEYFGTNLKILPNRNIFNRDGTPGFVDVTNIVSSGMKLDGVK